MIHQLTTAARNHVSVALEDRAFGGFDPCFSRKVMATYTLVRNKNPDVSEDKARYLTSVFLGCDDDAEVQAVLYAADSAEMRVQQARRVAQARKQPIRRKLPRGASTDKAPFLTYSKPIAFIIDGKAVRPHWRSGLIEVIRLALLNDRPDLITVPWWNNDMRPQGAGAGICDIDELAVSFQDQGAHRAWQAIQNIAFGLGLSVTLTVWWTRGPRYGRVHTLSVASVSASELGFRGDLRTHNGMRQSHTQH